MARIPVTNISRLGIVADIPSHELPPEAWSDGRNVRFIDDKVSRFLGHSTVFDPPTVAPYWAMGVTTGTDFFWMYASLTKVYTVTGGTHTNITRQTASVDVDYNAGAALGWNGGILVGVPIINNGVDAPQEWTPIGASTKLADLTNWPASTACQIFRPFKNYGIALHVTKSGTVYPHMVKWSHPADPGAVPSSWDETDATKDAGEVDLTDIQAGVIRDGLALGDQFIIYKEAATHGMRHIGGVNIFRFYNIFTQSGILSNQCVAPTPDGRGHFVATNSDIIVHDGNSLISIGDRRLRKFIFNNIDGTNYTRSFCTVNNKEKTNWFCFPQAGSTWPNLALIWHQPTNTITLREMTDISFLASGIVEETVDATWDADSGIWDADLTAWDTPTFSPLSSGLLACDPVNTKFYNMNTTNQFNGVSYNSYIERQGLALLGKDRQGNPQVDYSARKLLTRVYPHMTSGPVNIRIGAQERPEDAVAWQPVVAYDPSTQDHIDVVASGRLFSIRFEGQLDTPWELYGYDLEIEPLGTF